MLTIQFIKENKETTIAGLNKKYFKDAENEVNKALEIDENRRQTQVELDNTLAKANGLAKEIGAMMQQGKKDEANVAKAETGELKAKSKVLEETLKAYESNLYDVLVTFPNLPHTSVPVGKTPEENEVVLENGAIPILPENAAPHWDLIK